MSWGCQQDSRQAAARMTAAMATHTDAYRRDNGVGRGIKAQITPVANGPEPGEDTIISVYPRGFGHAQMGRAPGPASTHPPPVKNACCPLPHSR